MTQTAGPRLTRRAANVGFLLFAWAATALALVALAAILWSLLSQGLGGLDLKVFTMSTPAPGSEGGLLNAILGSIMMSALGLAVAMTVGAASAGSWRVSVMRLGMTAFSQPIGGSTVISRCAVRSVTSWRNSCSIASNSAKASCLYSLSGSRWP